MPQTMHENLDRPHEPVGGSDRAFGLVFATVFAVIAVAPLLWGNEIRPVALAVAGVFLLLALLLPSALRPLNRLWTWFGLLLHRIVSPLAMAVIFFGVLTPVAVIRRLMGHDELRLRKAADEASYWILRHPPGPPPDTMRRMF